LQEALSAYFPKFAQKNWWPGIIITSLIFTSLWGYLVVTGDIFTIWPLFGMSNQLLASCALIIGTSMLIRIGRMRYAFVTAIPGLFMAFICLWAGYIQIVRGYIPQKQYVLTVLGLVIVALMISVLISTIHRWISLMTLKNHVLDSYGEEVLALAEDTDNRA
jgi:carbon starvation protein